MIFAWLAVILVVICVACANFALTAAWISALQSMLLLVLVPDVVMVLVELEEEDDDDVVAFEVALLTVMTGDPSDKNRAGIAPARQIVH